MRICCSLERRIPTFSRNNIFSLIITFLLGADGFFTLEQTHSYCSVLMQSDDHCCNSCDEVREAYKKKSWGLSNPELIDQVNIKIRHNVYVVEFSELTLFFTMQCQREGLFQQIKEEDGEGCNIKGFLEVSKVSGNFHFSPGKSLHQQNLEQSDQIPFQKETYNVSSILT